MLAPDTILNDRYRIIGLLGKGGMGAIYEAVDRDLSCTVAIKENLALTEELRYAFTREAKLLANLHHPALPKVMHHFSLKDGQFLVMEFISGKNLAEMLLERKNTPFSPKEVLSWADVLLDVMTYLHRGEKPIVHGDIKPANLKLSAEQTIFLLDFGLAKGKAGLMSSLNTSFPVLGYSPNYAPLEQALRADVRWYNLLAAISTENAGRILREGTEPRSDLFSLGATLYHLITGSCPPEAATRAAHIWAGQPDPLVLANELNSQVTPAVADVLARAMALRRDDRFASAVEMRQAFRDAGLSLPTESVRISQPSPIDVSSTEHTRRLAVPVSAPTLLAIKYGVLGKCESSVRSVAFSTDGRHLASGSNDNAVRLWNAQTGEVRVLGRCDFSESGFSYVASVSFSLCGRYIASGSSDQTVRVWDVQADEMRILGRCDDSVCAVAFSPGGKSIASGSNDGSIHLWDVPTGKPRLLGECDSVVWAVAFSPDGKSIASESGNRAIQLWDIDSGRMRALETNDNDVWSVAFSADGMYLASGSWDQHVRIWEVATGAMRILGKCDGVVRSVAFSPDGKLLASGSDDNSVRVWNIQTAEMRIIGSCEDVVSTVAFSPDGRSIASGSWDNKVRLWKVA
jgi:serine/threonine protein kinase